MINIDDYRLAWQVYLGVGSLAMLVWFWLLRRISSVFLRYWLLFAALAFLFIPGRHPAEPELLVPGSASAVLSLMTEGIESAMSTVILLAAGQILALILAIATATMLASGQKAPAPAKTAAKSSKSKPYSGRKEPSL